MMTVLLFFLSVIIIPASLAEFSDWLPRLSQRLLGRAADRLGDDALADRYAEEWAAELEEIPGKYSKLGYALGRLIHMRIILKELRIDRERFQANPQRPAPELDYDPLELLGPPPDRTVWLALSRSRGLGRPAMSEYGSGRDLHAFDYGDLGVEIVVDDAGHAYWAQVENQSGLDGNTTSSAGD